MISPPFFLVLIFFFSLLLFHYRCLLCCFSSFLLCAYISCTYVEKDRKKVRQIYIYGTRYREELSAALFCDPIRGISEGVE